MAVHPEVILASPAWSLNGPNVFSARLARGLIESGIPARIVLTRPDWHDAKPLPRPPDVPIHTLPVARFLSLPSRWEAMRRYLLRHAPCIYLPNYDFGHSCICPTLPAEVAVVGIVHSDDSQHYEHAARLGRYWNAIVAVSPAIGRQLENASPELAPRTTVIPYGVPVPPAPPTRLSAPGATLRALYAGRLEQDQKRVLDLAGIAFAARQHGVPLHLKIAGSGPLESRLRARVETLGLSPHVEFLGTLDSDNLRRATGQSEVFLLASAYEGLPIGVLEAMAQGCVPIVSDIRSGVRELIENGVNGFRVTPGHLDGFARRLAELHGQPGLLSRMSAAAAQTIVGGGYGVETMVERYAGLFRATLDAAASGLYRRPAGPVLAPPGLPWREYLPGPVQRAGHALRSLTPAVRRSEQGA